ncbi:uncharacterized protein LOC128746066 [Sabethes cyaneus]|uniref:uncharacterized protein LOC128746066 n=1 Tax=Sabethes cyaneus TaxID=53552 RepID=UPI00237EA04A|nr:uncharacterized protein LOC128746066 [Sabethes cyaneus]
MFGAGSVYPHVNQTNTNTPYIPVTVSQYISNPFQNPTISQSMPVGSVIDQSVPTSRQLAARHVMPKELPIFSGSPEEWPMFYSAFYTSTEACGYSEVENLGRLQRCLKGSALEAVRSRLLLPSAVPQVMQTLQLLYGRPEQIISALLTKIRDVPTPRADNLRTLVTFGMAVQNFCDYLVAAGQVAHLSNPLLLQELIDRLPAHLKLDWVAYKRQFMVVDLRVFGGYMANLVTAAADVTLTLEPSSTKAGKADRVKGFVNAHATEKVEPVKVKSEPSKANQIRCLTCNDPEHRVKECETFKKMSTDDRWKAVQTHQLCRICLGKHGRKPCRSQMRCDIQGCQMRHHPLLHRSSSTSTTTSASSSHRENAAARNQSEGVNAHRDNQSETMFRILPVTLHGNGRSVDTFAFIDEGSSVTLMEKWIADTLDIKGVRKRLCLSWTGNVTRDEEDSHQVTVAISGCGADRRYNLEGVRTVSALGLPTQSLRYGELAKQYHHLRQLPVVDYESVTPGILIGAGHTVLTATKQLREGRSGEPIAAKTRLGWAVYGPVKREMQSRSYHLHVCECTGDANLHEMVKQYFSVENVGVSADSGPESEDEKRARLILERTTRRVEGAFETGLLWRHDQVEFPDSYGMAVRRLQCFERRLKANPAIEQNVRRQIVEYQQKGYIHEVTREELESADPCRVWYLPLSVVQNPKKPKKIRLVWDAAAKVDGISLNSMLLKGPDLVVPLPTVLCGFRERRIAVGGDLQEMFHQVKIRSADRNAQRFLMRDNPNQKPRVFIMDVATFGSTSSPCSAQYIKNLNAQDFIDRYPRAVEAIQRRHYVDDYLDSFDSEEEACRVAEEVKIVHKKGGFTMRNWLSNSNEVLRRVGATDGCREKAVEADKSGRAERVLGMLWASELDVFVYANGLDFAGIAPTKRGILRCVMSQYDPLGLLSHFFIHGRVIIQDIWRTKAGWDDIVGGEILERWQRWTSLFDMLHNVSISRAYFPSVSSEEIEDLQLHIFVDASETAYACVGYFRAKIRGEFRTALRWVPTKENVADEATKWGKGPNLLPDSRWFTGPKFLREPEVSWPQQYATEETPEELKPCMVQHIVSQDELIEWSRFSKFERVWRALAYVHRIIGNMRRKRQREQLQRGHLTQDELTEAQDTVWSLVQKYAFPEEVKLLTAVAGQGLPAKIGKSSRIYKLSPFMDDRGVIRMDSRLCAASFMPFEAKFPIILPKTHPLTILLLDWYHRAYLHENTETVINEIRQRFHVPSLRTQLRKVVRLCMYCKVKKAKPCIPRMAPLPEARLSPFVRPFSFVGLDYFGPMQAKVGRSLVKRWVALFTCLTIRAVHLEIVYSLSTDSCKKAIRRFLVRRGSPLEIWSDNGTNFVGASRELEEEIKRINEQMSEVFTNANTKWIFNPPSAPHMGGSWERLVRSIKTAFASLSITRNPDEETLMTLLIEAEGVVNSRPLTVVPLDNEAQESLTPNHFLQLSSQGVTQRPQPLMERAEPTRSNWRRMRCLVDEFWYRWIKEYLPTIASRSKWVEDPEQLKEGDLVFVVDESTRNGWLRGKILSATKGLDGRVRQAFVKTRNGVLRRPATKIAVLGIEDTNSDEEKLDNAGRKQACDPRYGSGDAALKALKAAMCNSKLVWECILSLRQLAHKNLVNLYWVPGHCGIEGNEKVDLLARKGSSTRCLGPEPFCGFSSSAIKTELNERPNQTDPNRRHRQDQTRPFYNPSGQTRPDCE